MNHQTGSCCCNRIKYQLSSELLNVVNCHCNFCRSHSGSAFTTYAALPYSSFAITEGQDRLKNFQTDGGKKHFCGECGTPIFNLNDKYPGACMVYLGTLENAREITPRMNIWCESELGWIDSVASLPSVAQGIERKK